MIKLISSDIYYAFIQYAPPALLSGGAVMMVIFIVVRLLYGKGWAEQFGHWKLYALIYILYSYCFIVVSITLLSREPGSRDSLDLMPFRTFSPILWNNRYPIENIILFIPFGFMLPFLSRLFKKVYPVLGLGFGFSIMIEIIQYITQRGYFQTDDIITNVLGTMIGYFIAYCVQRR